MSRISRFVIVVAFAAGACLVAASLDAASETDSTSMPRDPTYEKAEKAVKAKDFKGAIPLLEKVVSATPRHADALNYLGYSHRKLGRFDEALAWYRKALVVNPDHRGANEYLGELYLQMGDLKKAQERLAHLDEVCFFGCDEYDDLKQAIAAYKPKS